MDGSGCLADELLPQESASPAMSGLWPWAWTLTLWWAMVGVGTALAMLGPTLEELAQQLDLQTAAAGSIFTVRATGYLIGSLWCGDLLQRFRNAAVIFTIPLLATCAGAFAIPTVTSYPLTCVLFSFQGISMGMLDTAGNVVMLNLWRGSGYQEGFVHAFHFLFGLGAAIAPMIVGLVLKQEGAAISAWYVVGFMFIPSVVAFLAMSKGPQPFTGGEEEAENTSATSTSIVLLIGAFLFIYVGIEVAFGGYIDLFAVRWLHTSKVNAAALTSVYWIALSASRAVAAIVTSFVHHARYLAWHLLLAIVSIGLLCVTTEDDDTSDSLRNVVVLIFLFGFALGPLFPGALLVAEELNGGRSLPERDTGKIVGAAAAGEMCLPLFVGAVFAWSPWNFCLAQLALCVSSTALFLVSSGGLVLSKKH